jgi:hypothetical protein
MQKTVSLSTTETEYYAKCCTYAICETQRENIEVNTACIEWGNHVISGRERAKHIDIRKHFAHEAIQNSKMRLVKIGTSNKLADISTKPLQLPRWDIDWEWTRATKIPLGSFYLSRF